MGSNIGRRVMLGTTFIALVGVAAVAIAQPAREPGRSPAGGQGHGMMGGGAGMMGGGSGMMGRSWNTENYLDSLKTELGITANQETAWKEYADTVSSAGTQMQGLHQSMFDAMGTASWQERREMMNQMFQVRQQTFDTVHEAAGKLMSVLNPAQKAKAQATLPGLAYGPGMMGRHGPGMMGRHGPASGQR